MKKLVALALLCALLLVGSPAHAQGDVYVSVDSVDTASYPNIQVNVTVRNQYGVPVADLDQIDFTVTEDGSAKALPLVGRPDRRQNEEFPMSVVVVLDVSGSMAGKPLAEAKVAATNLLKQLEYGGGRAGIIAFSNTIDLDPGVDPGREQPITGDFTAIYSLIGGLQAGGWTPLYDAAYKAVRWAAAEPTGSRAVVLLTDGKERKGNDGKSGSRMANEESAIHEANLSNVPVFTIGLKSADLNEPFLERLARETGGTYRLAPDAAQLDSLFQAVAGQLRQQVRLTYQSATPADGKEHTVQVEARVAGHTGFHQATFAAPPAPPTPVYLVVDVDWVDASNLPNVLLEVSARDQEGVPIAGIVADNVSIMDASNGEAWPIVAVAAGEGGRLSITCTSGLSLDGQEHAVLLQIVLPDGLSGADQATFITPVPPPPPDIVLSVGQPDAAGFPEVKLDFTVADEKGAAVERLTTTDLALAEDGQAVGTIDSLEALGQDRYSLSYRSTLKDDGVGHTVQVQVTLPDGRTASDKTTITTPPPKLPWYRNPWSYAGVLGGLLALIAAILVWRRHESRQWVWIYRCMDCGHDLADEHAPCPCGSTKKPFRVRVRRKDVMPEG